MMTILNRSRGTYGYFAKVTGIILGLLFWFTTGDIWMLIVAPLYVLGESFGWGKWIWGVHNKQERPAIQQELDDTEGRNNGVHYLADKLFPETVNYYKYCFTALTLRGMLWFGLTILPLVIGGYISIFMYLILTILLGFGFPLSVRLGSITEYKFNYTSKYFSMNGYWEHAEVWYGLIQDITLVITIGVII